MWNKNKAKGELIEVFEETIGYLKPCDNISVDGLSAAEVCMDLEIAVYELREKTPIDRQHLQMLFAPTGLIQEHAIINNWEDKYAQLSNRFDQLITKVKATHRNVR